MKLLLDRKDVDPRRPNKNDRTPLGCPTDGLLLDRKDVDPNRLDKNDRTPLGYAALRGQEGVVGLLLHRKDVSPNRPDKCWIVAYRAWGYAGLRICRIALCG